jgi:hypothetical protein
MLMAFDVEQGSLKSTENKMYVENCEHSKKLRTYSIKRRLIGWINK